MTANSGNDTLISGTGIDTLVGGSGIDVFYINNSSDIISGTLNLAEIAYSSVNYALSSNINKLTLTGSSNLTATANNNNGDVLTANSGNDTLVSGTGVNTLVGGSGIDTFYINNSSDIISGTLNVADIAYSSVNYALSSNINKLTLTGSANLTATANNNNDTITANTGNDIITGGSGSNTYIFNQNYGQDTIFSNSGKDAIKFGSGLTDQNVALFMSGNNLLIGNAPNSLITVQNQTKVTNAIQKIQLSDGKYLSNVDINNIIQQMTAFASKNNISLTSINTVEQNTNLMNIIANSWHN